MTQNAAPAGTTLTNATFEEAMLELEAIVARMDDGSLGLAESLGAYKRGVELVKHCHASLEAVREQVQVLEAEGLKPLAPRGDDALE